jgi:hypothetical protein
MWNMLPPTEQSGVNDRTHSYHGSRSQMSSQRGVDTDSNATITDDRAHDFDGEDEYAASSFTTPTDDMFDDDDESDEQRSSPEHHTSAMQMDVPQRPVSDRQVRRQTTDNSIFIFFIFFSFSLISLLLLL